MPILITKTLEFNNLSFTNIIYLTLKVKVKQTTLILKTNELKFILLKVIYKPIKKYN